MSQAPHTHAQTQTTSTPTDTDLTLLLPRGDHACGSRGGGAHHTWPRSRVCDESPYVEPEGVVDNYVIIRHDEGADSDSPASALGAQFSAVAKTRTERNPEIGSVEPVNIDLWRFCNFISRATEVVVGERQRPRKGRVLNCTWFLLAD